MTSRISKVLLPCLALLVLFPIVSSGAALILGIGLSLVFGNPYLDRTRLATSKLLGWSVMGLGAGMDLEVVSRVGIRGIGYTIVSIGSILLLGTLLGRLLNVTRDTSILVTVGTAICGGSAIAAVAPTIQAKDHEVSVSLATIFLLNAIALLIFPFVGHLLNMSQSQFGLWSALAIHDTSSVVGATLQYGPEALQVGTTVKLARALWIVPITLAIGFLRSRGQISAKASKAKRPWFILGFIIAAAWVTWVPALRPAGHIVDQVAKRTLVLTLFLIGTHLTRATVRSVGFKPLFQGVLLWIMAGLATLAGVETGWIHL